MCQWDVFVLPPTDENTNPQESTDDPETKAGGKPGQKLDDDEDRKNPAYIPRKGLFFEHDVRGHAQEEERYQTHSGPTFRGVTVQDVTQNLGSKFSRLKK